jgi:transposase
VGQILALGRLYDIPAIRRFPRVQAFVSAGRLVTCAQESAGIREGTSGQQSGHASLTWAFSDATVLFVRHHPAGHTSFARWAKNHRQGTARTVLGHTWARAVYDMLTRDTAVDLDKFCTAWWSGAGEPAASLAAAGISLARACW